MSLIEVMYAMAIGVFVIGTATWFIFEGMKASLKATNDVENSIQQWGLSAKLQIDGKVANGVTIFYSADQSTWQGSPALPVVIPVDDGNAANGLERGKVLVLTKTKLVQGFDTKLVTDIIFYYYTGGNLVATGTLKRYPGKDLTFKVPAAQAVDSSNKPKPVAQLVSDYYTTFTGSGAAVVQDKLVSIATDGPFAHFGDGNNASIALVREETNGAGNIVKSSNLTEVSFNLR